MAEPQPTTKSSNRDKEPWRRRLMPLAAVSACLAGMAVLYLTYDVVKGRMSPCESIFQQTSLGLKTKLTFLKAEGELEIGRDKLEELSERAQMTALNLKTCCTVLDAGRLEPEQFLQCKSNARRYEARVAQLATSIAPKAANATAITTGTLATGASLPASESEVKKQVNEAIAVSKTFNKQVVKIRKAQVLETLEAIPPQHVDVAAKEKEPNDNLLSTNQLKPGSWVTASVGSAKDADVFSFTTPETHRDWITVELQNRSTTLEPMIQLFNSEKSSVAQHYRTTSGSDLKFSFVSNPDDRHFVRVSSYYGKNTGVYLLRVVANKSYDTFEPNETILDAKSMTRGEMIEAAIMDRYDSDFYALEAAESARKVTVKVANTSKTLHPMVTIFDSNKNGVHSRYSTTAGADVGIAFDVPANQRYFIKVHDYYQKAGGSYRLSVDGKAQEKAGP